jgi:precorrin-6A/cobalt-precorrin-6A reductase
LSLGEVSGRIWLIGGTSESVQLAAAIASANLPCTITVTTEAARTLYPDSPMLRVWVGRLFAAPIGQFLQAHQIVAVLDASHPYAVEVSQSAIAACTQFNLPYLRYERPSLKQANRWASEQVNREDSPITHYQLPITHLDSFETLIAGDYLLGQRVLLTVGYKVLPLFRPWQEKATLFTRILPSMVSLEAALAAGFTPDRIIALRPPISADLETALWRFWNISMVVTKASGSPGGEDVKQAVATELGVTLITIDRPLVNYPAQTSDLGEAIAFCQQFGMGNG